MADTIGAVSLGHVGQRAPEGWHRDDVYRDTGCKLGGPSCLSCPLPVCIEDMSQQERAELPPPRRPA